LLSGLIGKRNVDHEASLENEVEATLGKKAVEQARRMQRQVTRLLEFEKIITTDKGLDFVTNCQITMTPSPVSLKSYDTVIQQVIQRTRDQGVGAASVAGGLRLVGITREQLEGPDLWAVAHVFFHLRHPGQECRFVAGKDEGLVEFRELQEGPGFVDLVALNMYARWGRTVYHWMEPEETVDLVIGEIRMFAQWDMDEFFAFAARRGVELTWVTGRDAERLKREKLSQRIPGSPNAWGIRAIMPDGSSKTLLSGFVARVLGDLTTPRQLLDLIKTGLCESEGR
jgi:hypothetical protein